MSDKFNNKELEDLKALTLQHRRGEISDQNFNQGTSSLLKGRDFPILTQLAQNQISSDSSLKKERKSIDTDKSIKNLTSCDEKSRKTRNNYLRKHKQDKSQSLVLKSIKEEKKAEVETKVIKPLGDSLILSESISTTIINDIIYKEEDRYRLLLGKFSVFFLATLLVLTMAVANFGFKKKTILDSDVTNKLNNLSKHNANVKIYFGPSAVAECSSKCELKNGKNCAKLCRKLSFIMYPRRVSLLDNSPKVLSKRIKKACLKENKSYSFSKNYHGYSINSLLAEYEKTTISSEPTRNICLKSNLILAKLGEQISNNYKDNYSLSYYKNLVEALVND